MTTVFRHPRIHTGVAGQPPVAAVAVRDGTVLAAGAEADVRRAAGSRAELVDLPGAAVLPGLHDAHVHTAHLAREVASVDVRHATSLEQVLTAVTTFAATLPPGVPVTGGRWNHNGWDVPEQPDRRSLDSICPDRLVALASLDGHTMWTNTRTLDEARIDRHTPDPPGGQVDRDADGEPTGILREAAADALDRLRPPEDLTALLRTLQDRLLGVGLTSITDIDGEDCRAAYLALHNAGELRLRVHKSVPGEHLAAAVEEGRRTGDGDDWFGTGPVKLFSDGALGSHTCLLSEPFADDAASTGLAVLAYEQIRDAVALANGAGLAVATHAIGDLAARTVLDAYAAAGVPAMRNRVEHAQHLQRADVARLARLGVIASMQPTHCTTDIELAQRRLGERDMVSYGWRSVLDAGGVLAFGSDAPVEPPDPLHALAAAVSRQRADGWPAGGWQPEERVTIAEAVQAHTVGAAFAVGREHRKGTLAPGMLADLVAVDVDPFVAAPQEIWRAQALTTVVGGRVRWQR